MPAASSTWQALDELGLGGWRAALAPLVAARLEDTAHGDLSRWRAAVESLQNAGPDTAAVRKALLELAPWRKGPFELGEITIDSEWQSNLKWDRVLPAIEPLAGRAVLDVGCGNGYYAYRMCEAGVRTVIGLDPTVLYIMQFRAIRQFRPAPDIHLLPLRLEEVPLPARRFDTTFSMGVLYHQRSPIEHLRQLRQTLRPGGQLVLETLFVPGEEGYACTPPDRYARMRNVWLLPTLTELRTWLERCGYRDVEFADCSVTTTAEQRTTEWMPFESLAEALDPHDPDRTVEGWPAPRRVVAVAKSP